MRLIIENDSISKYLKELKENGYNYIIKANDKFLGGWGLSDGKKHVQLIAVKTREDVEKVIDRLESLPNDFNYINWYKITETTHIFNAIKNKTYTIRNDFTERD